MGRTGRAVLLLLALVQASCSLNVGPPVAPRVCSDGLPPKMLTGQTCARGLCGYTCEPGRWPPVESSAR